MRVTDLIEILLDMPQDAEVKSLVHRDFFVCAEKINKVYISNKGEVIIANGLIESISKISDQPNPIQP